MFNQSFNNMNGKTTFLAKAFMMLFAVLFSLTGARAQSELTVYDGTAESTKVPAYIYYFDDFARSQFVIPAADLTDMAGATISKLKFYTSANNVPYTTVSTVDVYLMEVDYTTMTALEPKANGTIVYQGTLSVVVEGDGGSLSIELSSPYTYGGGNLLVGIENTTDAAYKSITFYGQAVAGAGWSGSNTSSLDGVTGEVQNFIPKTTFSYIPAGFAGPLKPTGLEVLYDGGLEATVRWISDEDLFDISVNDVVTEDVENGYALTGLNYATIYTVKVRAKKNGEVSDWTDPVTFHTEFEEGTCNIKLELTDSYGDGWNGNAINVIDVLTGIVIGTYANDGSTSKDPQTFYVEVPDKRTIQFTWKAGSYASECSYVAYDIDEEVIFSGSGTFSGPVNYTVNCTASPWRTPSDLTASEIGAFSVKLSWTENSNPAATSWVVAYYDENATSQEDIPSYSKASLPR